MAGKHRLSAAQARADALAREQAKQLRAEVRRLKAPSRDRKLIAEGRKIEKQIRAENRQTRIRESDEFALAFQRMAWTYAMRCQADPGALAYWEEMDRQWSEAGHVAHALCQDRYSHGQIADIRGVTRATVQARVRKGRDIIARMNVRNIMSAPSAREDRAQRHLAAGIDDLTAGPKERAAYLKVVGQ
jgi:hypothetical protein